MEFAKTRATGMVKLAARGVRGSILGYGAVLLLVVGQCFRNLTGPFQEMKEKLATLPAEQRAEILAQSLGSYVTPILFVGGMMLGYGLSLAYAQKRIRPLLLARAPEHAGGALGCRCCGGHLPAVRDAFVDCEYCGAQNLVTGNVAERMALVWEKAAKGYGLRVDEAAQKLQDACKPWIFWVAWGGSMAATLLAPRLLIGFFL